MKRLFAILFLALAVRAAASQIALPIYIEDNHAGAFYWLAQQLDLEERCTLLHFDAHSDASGIFDSDKIRAQLREVDSLDQRALLLQQWRQKGVVQCFNWIEPLMPAPISQVIWIQPNEEKPAQVDAVRQLDGHLEAAPRRSGSFQSLYRVRKLSELEKDFAVTGPLIVSIDLDYFAEVPPNEQSAEFERIWKFVCERRDLRAIVIAISRPYLRDDAEADRLLRLALRGALSLPTARIEFQPARTVGNDRSLRAQELRAQKKAVPAFSLTSASAELRNLLRANRARIRMDEPLADAAPEFLLSIKNHSPSTDGIWRVKAEEDAQIEVRAVPWMTPFENVRWFVQTPIYERCNLVSNVDDGTLFARGAPPRPRWAGAELPTVGKSFSLSALREFFDGQLGCGAMRVYARINEYETAPIEIRRSIGSGFRAALSEQFQLPYLFGSGQLRDGENTGPETGWGADCANFVVYALRRHGRRVPWSNPKQLRHYLETRARHVSLGNAPSFTADDLELGLIVHLRSHVAALMEDRPPLGVLNATDIVVHQLEGKPGLVSLGELLRERGETHFDFLQVPAPVEANDLLIGGDVMLGRSIGVHIQSGLNPFAEIAETFRQAGATLVNLECVSSNAAADEGTRKKYQFRAPPDVPKVLKASGCTIVGLANNHSLDLGERGLRDCVARLRANDLAVVGAGATNEDTFVPHFLTTRNGQRIAILGVTDIADADSTLVARASDRTRLEAAITSARAAAKFIVAFVHWGDENTAEVNERQRALARWLIDHGVDLVAGSHPHCLQPLDFYHGRAIIYSLGNLVFDGGPTVPSWNNGQVLGIGLDNRDSSPSLRLLPVHLDARGFPRLTRPSALSQR